MKPFRGKPQQLTLFQAPKPTDAHRWPEGYSPERRNDVASRLEVTQRGESPASRYGSTRGGSEWTDPNPKPSVGQKNVIGDIARSSVPLEHLESPARHDKRTPIATRSDMNGGRYQVGAHKIEIGASASPTTLLHEIGHAASAITKQPHSVTSSDIDWNDSQKTEAAKQRAGARNMGKEEAFADNYARAHLGARRGETPKPDERSAYEFGPEVFRNQYLLPAEHARIAYKSYMNARQFTLTSEAQKSKSTVYQPTLDETSTGRTWSHPRMQMPRKP